MSRSKEIELKKVWVESDGPLFGVCGNPSCESIDPGNDSIVGIGPVGYLAASLFACDAQKDCTFVRLNQKLHGTRNIIDGVAIDSHRLEIFTLEADVTYARQILEQDHEYPIARINIVTLRECQGNFSTYDPPKTRWPSISLPKPAADYVRILSDDSKGFVLSSGRVSCSYYDTLPAANSFELVANLSQQILEELRQYDSIIGMAFGGIFFGVSAALLAKTRPCMMLHSAGSKASIVQSSGKVMLVDDFVGTGAYFRQSVRSLRVQSGEFRALTLYKVPGDVDIFATKVDTLVELPRLPNNAGNEHA